MVAVLLVFQKRNLLLPEGGKRPLETCIFQRTHKKLWNISLDMIIHHRSGSRVVLSILYISKSSRQLYGAGVFTVL